MALVLKDRVKGWTDSYGEDNFVIFATTNGYQSFSVIGNGNQTYYTVFDPTNYDWEVGIGTYTAATTTLSRDTILSSSNNNLIVSFLPGTKELFVGYPAEKAVTLDTPQTITDKTLVNATVTSGTINNTTIGATTPASGAFTTLVASGASLTSVNAGVALLTSATVTTLNATGASIASANIGNLQFTAASIASINAGVAVITNLSATSASIASMNASVALLTTATVTNLTATGASIASANIGNLQFTAASIASINAGVAVITNLTATGASIASANVGTAVITAATVTGASIASANVGTAVVTGLTVTNASIASLNAGTATVTSGNLTFSSTGQRITGDMSTATFSNRLAFQTSTANSATSISSLPNGTGTASNINCYNNSDPTNSSLLLAGTNATEALIQSAIRGTGTYLPMTFYTGGSERMRLDTSGNLGIGVTPSQKLDVAGTSRYTFNVGNAYTLQTSINAAGSAFADDYKNALSHIWQTSGTERMRIDTSGNVGIGTSSPGSFYSEARNLVVGTGTGGQGMTIYAGTASQSRLMFADGTTGSDPYTGFVQYDHSSNALAFGTNGGTERMRIDSSGNVSIGTTASTLAGSTFKTIINYAGGGVFGLNNSNNTNQSWGILINDSGLGNAGRFNIVQNVNGSTGGYGGGPCVPIIAADPPTTANTTPRLLIDSSGNVLVGITSATSGGGVLQISNGITFPATQSASSNANTLDDYEEGTWTPTLKNASSSSTFTSNTGRYTKIGRLVYCSFVNDSGNTGTAGSDITLSGLPFAYGGTSNVPTLVAFTANGIPAAVNCYLSRTINGSTSFVVRDAAGNALTNQLTFAAGTIIYEV